MLLAALLLIHAAAAPAAVQPVTAEASPAVERAELPASNGRKISLSIYPAAQTRGVILFGHGMGGEPAHYGALIKEWQGAGFTVVAPLAVDSRAHPQRASFDQRSGFGARVEDLMITRGYIASRYPGQKVILAGHSYGSLFSLIGAGAKTPAGPLSGPPVSALLLFSSPGAIPGVVAPGAFAGVEVPMLMVTGDKDIVPGFVPDPKAHRLPFEEARAASQMLVTVKGGGHFLASRPDEPGFAAVSALSRDFLLSVVGGDRAATQRLASRRTDANLSIERR